MRFVPKHLLRGVFTLTLIIGLLWRTLFILFMPDNPSASYVIPFGQMDSWSIGGLVALNTGEKGKNDKLMYGEMLVGLVGIILLIILNASLHQTSICEGYLSFRTAGGYMTHPLTGNIHLFIGILSAGMLRYCIDSSRRHPVLSSSALVALGGMTYELYCFHYPIQVVAKHCISNQLLMVIAALVITCIVSLIWSKWLTPVVNKIIKNGASNY